MATRDQWAQLTRQLMGEHAPTYLRIQRGGFASGGRAILWSIGRRDTFAIAAHEGWHQFTQRTFRDELPPWLEEGIGVYMEGFRFDDIDPAQPIPAPWANLERFDQLVRASAEHRLEPLSSLIYSSPQELIHRSTDTTLTWYAQVWALTHFLSQPAYRERLRMLLADAAHGTVQAAVRSRLSRPRDAGPPTMDDVFAAYFGPIREMDSGYREFVEAIVRADRDRIAGGSSPEISR
jgi:hypothetical protein